MRRREEKSHPVMDVFKRSGNQLFFILLWLAGLYTHTHTQACMSSCYLSLRLSLFNTLTHHSCHYTCWYPLFIVVEAVCVCVLGILNCCSTCLHHPARSGLNVQQFIWCFDHLHSRGDFPLSVSFLSFFFFFVFSPLIFFRKLLKRIH